MWSLCEDRAGTLWMGTLGGGLLRYRDGIFTAFTKADGLAGDFVYALCEGRMVRSGRNEPGPEPFSPGPLGNLPAERPFKIRALGFDRTGMLWVGTEGAGLHRVVGGQLARLPWTKLLPGYRHRHPGDFGRHPVARLL
ncbi:hypothetical protein J8C07_12960 [Chloracidobacterium sp. S]|nr:hypothetical protein J8C07_12960 [Chloracidobacterium sp. S]